ncbi:putative membrane protein [Clostridium bornimense]|uniref:Putative membrane protein n=1 Tax=Clostridium bornimense TaxID=1216932 RepID=W6SKN6_9CLOT|nr:hypothetical protein [Clostridium bornimense]CDM70475.1 putative membrane protein [Clostridium bornimense]
MDKTKVIFSIIETIFLICSALFLIFAFSYFKIKTPWFKPFLIFYLILSLIILIYYIEGFIISLKKLNHKDFLCILRDFIIDFIILWIPFIGFNYVNVGEIVIFQSAIPTLVVTFGIAIIKVLHKQNRIKSDGEIIVTRWKDNE